MRVVWAGLVVVVQPPAGAGRARLAAWPGAAGHDLVLHQVSAWLSGLRQGAQAASPLAAFPVTQPPRRPEPAPEQDDSPLPGFYL